MEPIDKLLATRHAGVCKFYNVSTGYGYITGDDGIDRFFSANHVAGGQTICTADRVSFIASSNARGLVADRILADQK
jgi:cold shock CspA family protein